MKLGLVFSGGGGKGAYEIGVWKALNELKIDKYVSAISGTSIGALNSILFIQENLKIAEELWLNLDYTNFLPYNSTEISFKNALLTAGVKRIELIKKYAPKILEKGNKENNGLINILKQYVDFNKIKNQKKVCYVACSELPDLKPKYFKINDYDEEEIFHILIATTALPIIYGSQKVREKEYLDGGITDNSPIKPLYDDGCDLIIVVHLNKGNFIEENIFPNCKLINIKPKNENLYNNILDFSKESIKIRIEEGYKETLDLFEPMLSIFKIQKYQSLETLEVLKKSLLNFMKKLNRQ